MSAGQYEEFMEMKGVRMMGMLEQDIQQTES